MSAKDAKEREKGEYRERLLTAVRRKLERLAYVEIQKAELWEGAIVDLRKLAEETNTKLCKTEADTYILLRTDAVLP